MGAMSKAEYRKQGRLLALAGCVFCLFGFYSLTKAAWGAFFGHLAFAAVLFLISKWFRMKAEE